MKIKEQTRKLAAGCSKHCFEVVDRTDEVSNIYTARPTLTQFEFDFRRVLSENEKNKTHSIKAFQHLIVCVFLIVKIFSQPLFVKLLFSIREKQGLMSQSSMLLE